MSDMVHRETSFLPSSSSVLEAGRKMRARSLGAILVTNGKGAPSGIFIGPDAVAPLSGRSAILLVIGSSVARVKPCNSTLADVPGDHLSLTRAPGSM